MSQKPSVYAELLAKRMSEHDTRCILLNTGWTGGPHGVGSRMSLKHTRTLLNAALAGDFDDTPSHATYSELAHANKLRRSPRRNFEPERNLG